MAATTCIRLFDALGKYLDVFQEEELFNKGERVERTLHEKTVALERKQFLLSSLLEKQRYLLEIYHEFEEHFQQLNTDLVDTTKENERDMLDQRNRQFSTILVAASIMLSALVAVLIQGKIDGASRFLTTAFAVGNAASMSFLFLSAVLCLEVVWRAFKFMNRSSRKQTNHIQSAVERTKLIVRDIREFQSGCPLNGGNNDTTTTDTSSGTTIEECTTTGLSQRCATQQVRARRRKDVVGVRFGMHEDKMLELYKAREEIIDQTADLVGATNDIWRKYTKNFENFWKDYCAIFGKLAVWCFYLGSACLLGSNVVFMWVTWSYTYNCPVGAWISLAVLCASLLASVYYIAYLRYFDVNRHIYKKEVCAVTMANPINIPLMVPHAALVYELDSAV